LNLKNEVWLLNLIQIFKYILILISSLIIISLDRCILYQQREFNRGKLILAGDMSKKRLKNAHAFLLLYSIREIRARFTSQTSDRANVIKRPNKPLAVINEKRSPFKLSLKVMEQKNWDDPWKKWRERRTVAERDRGGRQWYIGGNCVPPPRANPS